MYRKYFIVFGVVLLLGLNISYLVSFSKNLTGENLFKQKEYTKSFDSFPDTSIGYYNKGNSLYKLGKYNEAIKTYFSILGTGKNELDFRLNHNLGNSYYRYGESEKNDAEKKFYWEKSVSYYKNALKIRYNEQTKKNLEFVLKKLNELDIKKQDNKQNKKSNKKQDNKKDSQNKLGKSKEEKQQQDNKKQGDKGKNNNEKNSDKKKGNTGNNNENKKGEKKQGKGGTGGQSKKENQKGQKSVEVMKKNEEKKQLEAAKKAGLNEQEYKALKKYQKKLKNKQKNNMNYYGKVYQEPQQNSFFDNSINQGGNVRDW